MENNLVTVYGKSNCPFCDLSKKLLEKNNYQVDYISLDDEDSRKEFYKRVSEELKGPVMSVPQIWIGKQYIGGYNNLAEYIKNKNEIKFDEEF